MEIRYKLPRQTFSSEEKQKWMNNIFGIYKEMKEKSKRGSYEINFNGIDIIVFPDVYAPQFFSDSKWFSKELPKIIGKKSLLEIGTGTGIIGISCALKGAKVVLTDINSEAAKNAVTNVKKQNLSISVRIGNIYGPLKKNEKFDFIFWSHPYNNSDKPIEDMLMRSGFDHNYKGLKSYIRKAKNYLTPQGKLLLGTGSTADLKTIKKVADEAGYFIRILKKSEMYLGFDKKDKITNMIVQFIPKEKLNLTSDRVFCTACKTMNKS
ncbi:methyltransferase [Nanoarchaeota archaeon]